jgi:hypothetical protein
MYNTDYIRRKEMSQTPDGSYFIKLLRGNLSLSITYWIWFVFVTILIRYFIDINFEQINPHRTKFDEIISLVVYFLTIIYSLFIFVAVQRSARNYNGSKIWSFLAKVLVTVSLFFSIVSAYELIKLYLIEDFAIKTEIENFKKTLPLKVDSFVSLIDVAKNDKNIFYTYELSNLDLKKEVTYNFKKFKNNIQDSLCEESNSLKLLKKDYILNYTYIDKNKTEVIQVETTKESCGKNIYDLDILKEILRQESKLY